VTAAAGAVGSIVGQIAKIRGCYVVGLAGSEDKCKHLKNELHFDAVINYKTEDLKSALDTACPRGVDVYYDNTGGIISDNIIPRINKRARIVICGQISYYNESTLPTGPRLLHHLLWNSAKMQGFLVQDYEDKDVQTIAQLGDWLVNGQLKSTEDIVATQAGIDAAPSAFIRLFTGENNGKQMVTIHTPIFTH